MAAMIVLLRDRSEATSRRRFSRSSRSRRASRDRARRSRPFLMASRSSSGREGLGNVAVGALARSFDGRVQRGMRGDDDGNDVGVPVPRLLDQLQAGHPRHLQVHEEHGERAALHQLLEPRLAVPGGDHVVAFRGEDLAAALADAQLVVHHEDARRRRAEPAAARRSPDELLHPRQERRGGDRLVEERLGVHRRQVLGGARTEVESLLAVQRRRR